MQANKSMYIRAYAAPCALCSMQVNVFVQLLWVEKVWRELWSRYRSPSLCSPLLSFVLKARVIPGLVDVVPLACGGLRAASGSWWPPLAGRNRRRPRFTNRNYSKMGLATPKMEVLLPNMASLTPVSPTGVT